MNQSRTHPEAGVYVKLKCDSFIGDGVSSDKSSINTEQITLAIKYNFFNVKHKVMTYFQLSLLHSHCAYQVRDGMDSFGRKHI